PRRQPRSTSSSPTRTTSSSSRTTTSRRRRSRSRSPIPSWTCASRGRSRSSRSRSPCSEQRPGGGRARAVQRRRPRTSSGSARSCRGRPRADARSGTCTRRSASDAQGYQRVASAPVWRTTVLVVALSLATPSSASAHAIPLHVEPPPGSTVTTAPRAVFVTFDSPARVGPRNAAVRNDGVDVLGGKPRVTNGKRLVIPLQPGLGSGTYSVRWSIVSDDGHEEEGVTAFGIGTSGRPVSVLTTRGYVTWQRLIMRALFLLGVLGAAGGAFYSVFVLGGALPRRQAHLLFGCFVLAFAGADALIHATSGGGTRFERFMIVATAAAGVGAAASALAPLRHRLRFVVLGAAVVLFVCPTLAGHALDADQPAVIAAAADLLHLGGAAVWLGGVPSLALPPTPPLPPLPPFPP